MQNRTLSAHTFKLLLMVSSIFAEDGDIASLRSRALQDFNFDGATFQCSKSLDSCHLVNIETNTETVLTGNDSYCPNESSAGWSVRCVPAFKLESVGVGTPDTISNVDSVKFYGVNDILLGLDTENPYYMAGGGDNPVNVSQYLSAPGDKEISVEGLFEEESCWRENFKMEDSCVDDGMEETIAPAPDDTNVEDDGSGATYTCSPTSTNPNCFLINIDTDEDVQLPTVDSSSYCSSESSAGWTVRCEPESFQNDVFGGQMTFLDVDSMQFYSDQGEGLSIIDTATPYYMTGDDETVNAVPYLSSPGTKTFSVQGFLAGAPCWQILFLLEDSCNAVGTDTTDVPAIPDNNVEDNGLGATIDDTEDRPNDGGAETLDETPVDDEDIEENPQDEGLEETPVEHEEEETPEEGDEQTGSTTSSSSLSDHLTISFLVVLIWGLPSWVSSSMSSFNDS